MPPRPSDSSPFLDRGGKPTVRELLSSLVFNPVDGTITVNGDRIVMQRAAVGVELRRELIRLLGPDEARVFLIRLGYLSGRADARFVRAGWPGLDIGDAFTAGTRLHMFSGVVRVEVVHNDFDFRRKRFSGEFLWHDSVEAAEFRRSRTVTDAPACWTQLGYASGYASEFFDTLIVYKEVECAAEGHRHCRVVGKPAAMWGAGDADVALFRDRIADASGSVVAPPAARPAARALEAGLPELDRHLLAPVRDRLDRLARAALPVLIAGEPGTGRWRAARHLARSAGTGDPRRIAGPDLTPDHLAEVAGQRRGGRRAPAPEAIAIDGIEAVPPDLQSRLAAAVEDGLATGGPRLIALAASARPVLAPPLWLALAPGLVAMPALDARPPDDRLAIARALLPALCDRTGRARAALAPDAAAAVADGPWPGNLPELRAALAAALAGAEDGPVTAADLAAARAAVAPPALPRATAAPTFEAWLAQALDRGPVPVAALEAALYAAAVDRSGGNLAAAARLLGLTRPQLAYRLKARGAGAVTP